MKKLIGVLGVAALLMGSGVASADDGRASGKQATCPVAGGAVNPKLFVDYHGKRIYVCCKACLNEVWKDPARYVARLEQEGVELDKVEGGAE